MSTKRNKSEKNKFPTSLCQINMVYYTKAIVVDTSPSLEVKQVLSMPYY